MQNDASYKHLYAHAELVADLLRSCVRSYPNNHARRDVTCTNTAWPGGISVERAWVIGTA